MAGPPESFETLEHRYFRAWLNRDERTLKALTSSALRFVFASDPPMLLDGRSWLDAMAGRFHCEAYRFAGTPYVRRSGGTTLFAVRLSLEGGIDGRKVDGDYWLVDVWRRSRLRRRWQLTERFLSKALDDSIRPEDVGALQQWRPRVSRATSRSA